MGASKQAQPLPALQAPREPRGIYLVRLPKPDYDDTSLQALQKEFQALVAKLRGDGRKNAKRVRGVVVVVLQRWRVVQGRWRWWGAGSWACMGPTALSPSSPPSGRAA